MTTAPQFHFLVVDDQQIVRYTIVALLNALGHTKVSEADDGDKTLQLLETGYALDEPINFIITDWNMPHMNGLALLKKIRATAGLRNLPVLMITSEERYANITAATNAGADGYIIKATLDVSILNAAIENIMMRRGLIK